MKMPPFLLMTLVYLSLATMNPVQAAVLLALPLDGEGDFQNPDNLVFNQLRGGFAPNENTFERDVRSNRDNGQTFTLTGDTVIDKIAINFQDVPVAASSATFYFFAVTEPDAAALAPVSILDSLTFSKGDLTYEAGTAVFDVVNTPALAGSSFGIYFDTDSSSTLVFKWTFAGSDFEDGSRYESGNRAAEDDYSIGVIGVPEPGSALLVFLALAAGSIHRRRRA